MPTTGSEQYKSPKTPKKKEPVRRVALSDEARQAYEQLARDNAEREAAYGRHLHPSDSKRR